ncbi:MAG: phenylalanine--tRNA ligase subunit beta [Tannerella sp.]|jgi:phenylalanyl-tRNA synthetase beta chain|nr:phenylalanine--tRNA ligase subunit beta [Tannerella sp.]
MNISYNWLKEYLQIDLPPAEVAAALTSIGLETGSIEEIQPVKGGLEGLFIGEVLTCVAHPNADHLYLTKVDIGGDELLNIVCGAPNVAAGRKVIVAVAGTVLYRGDQQFTIKKCKIRGEESNGMICAEDEIGLGTSHEGIMVLPADAATGMPAKAYFGLENDYIFEVDITPNRIDGTSHFGVARDLAAYLKQAGKPVALRRPSTDSFQIDDLSPAIQVEVDHTEACIRYSGVTIRGVTVKESPDWLKKRLSAIGLRPINNVVDITNFVLHELGQPLHAFDASKIKGDKIVVRTVSIGTKCTTLDGVERSLTDQDLIICNAEEPLCLAGVFGGLDSGVTEQTTDVFLESACFHPVWVRRTARRFGLNTDASFRFERGLDPNQTVFALKRAAIMIKELAGGTITGEIQDIYPEEIKPFPVALSFKKINTLIGNEIPADVVRSILSSLEIDIVSETNESMFLHVPVYRIDVRRDVDVIEEILRIYGYNNVIIGDHTHSTLSRRTENDQNHQLEDMIAEQLCGAGFQEVLNNSLTRMDYYEGLRAYPVHDAVILKNPLSAELNCMRQTLLFGGLQNIAFNFNHKNKNLRFFEFGNCYVHRVEEQSKEDTLSAYREHYRLGLWIAGRRFENNWAEADADSTVFELSAIVENIFTRLGIDRTKPVQTSMTNDFYSQGLILQAGSGKFLGTLGIINDMILKSMDIHFDVYYAELSWEAMLSESRSIKVKFSDIPKYPEVKRDLALLLDRNIPFEKIKEVAFESARNFLKRVSLFDVYEGKNLPPEKKSYAVSFYLQDELRTLTDMQIDVIMSMIQKNLADRCGAILR